MNEINIAEVFQKLRTREDVVNFFREQSIFLKFKIINFNI